MNDPEIPPDPQRSSASELRKRPADERAAILEAQAALADEFHRRDRELTSLDACAEVASMTDTVT